MLRFFGNATLGWAIALAVAAVLLSLAGRYFPVERPEHRSRLGLVRTLVAAVAGFTALSAIVDLVTSLTAAGTNVGPGGRVAYAGLGLPAGIDGAITAALAYLGVAVIAGAITLWAFGLSRLRD